MRRFDGLLRRTNVLLSSWHGIGVVTASLSGVPMERALDHAAGPVWALTGVWPGAGGCRRMDMGTRTTSTMAKERYDNPERTGTDDGYAASTSQQTDDDASGDLERLRHKLLRAALEHVPRHGWSHAALVAGARDVGMSPAVAGILPRAEGELVEFFIAKCNARLVDELHGMGSSWQEMSERERLEVALQLRLEMLLPYDASWHQAMGVMAQPQNVPAAVKLMAMMVDDVLQYAGDTSTDHNWYTKRGLLAVAYNATELFMLTDRSEGKRETWDCLRRRLDDYEGVSKALGVVGTQLSPLIAFATDGLNKIIKGGIPKPPSGPAV